MSSIPSLSIREAPPPVTVRQYLLFRQDRVLFALPLASVREVVTLSEQPVTPVPNTLPFLLGLTNLRGETLAVADFGRFIGAESLGLESASARIVVLDVADPKSMTKAGMSLGLAVSSVEGVVNFNTDQLVSAADVSPEIAPILSGLYDWNHTLVMVVDAVAIATSHRW